MSPLWVCQYSLKPALATINRVADDAAENSTTAELAVVAAASTRVPTVAPTAAPTVSPTVAPTAEPIVAPTQPPSGSAPIPPRATVDTTLPSATGMVRTVTAGGDFQAALNASKGGDVVELPAGATFTGNYVLPAKRGSGKIWIRSSGFGSLPPQGTRIAPSNAAALAKIVSPNTKPALRFDFGASGYYLTGLDIASSFTKTTDANGNPITNANLVWIGADANGASASSLAQLPDRVIFDRCYIHGTPTGNTRRGITANGAAFAVVDSYISDIHEVGADSQAVGSWNGSGPFKISNNYLEGAGEVLMFGGADASVPNLVPSDATITGNTFAWQKRWNPADPSYDGSKWLLKNLFELKNAQRLVIRDNVFDYWFPSGQVFSVQLTVRNNDGTNPWAIVADVTFTNNRFRNILGSWINLLGHDSPGSGGGNSQQMARVLLANNLVESMSGDAIQVLAGPINLQIRHNTIIMADGVGTLLKLDGMPNAQDLVYADNVVGAGNYAVFGNNVGVGDTALSTYAPGAIFAGNVIYGPWPTPGGATTSMLGGNRGNFYPASRDDVGFVDLVNGNYALAPNSRYKGKATDGTDPGASFAEGGN